MKAPTLLCSPPNRGLTQTAELISLAKLFSQYEINLVSIKGPLLAHELYGDFGARVSKDIDIVISPKDSLKADGLLEQQGYKRQKLTLGQLRSHLKNSKDFVYWHPIKKICVELHWRLFQDWDCFSVFDIPLQTTVIAGVAIQHLSPEYNLLYLCTHGCESAWTQEKWRTDIQMLLAKYGENLNWQLVWNEAERWDLTGALTQGLEPPCVPAEALAQAGGEGNYVWRLTDWTHKLLLRKKTKNRIKVILSLFTPRAQDFDDLALPDSLFFLYYLARPVLALRRNLLRTSTAAGFTPTTAFASVSRTFFSATFAALAKNHL